MPRETCGFIKTSLACGMLQTIGIYLGVIVLWPRIRATAASPPPSAPAGTA